MSLLAEKLFNSTVRAKLLRFLLVNKEEDFSADELARRLRQPKDAVKKELTLLKKLGLVLQFGKNKAARYKLNSASKYVFPLEQLLIVAESFDEQDIVTKIKKVVKNFNLLVLSGAFTNNPNSEIDILIIGEPKDERKLRNAIASIESGMGTELRFVIFPLHEFELRLGMQDRLVKNVFDYPHKIAFQSKTIKI